MTDHVFEAEVSALVDRVLDLVMIHQDDKAGGPSQRFVMDVPDAWVTLAAWLEMRRRMRLKDRHGPSPLWIDEPSDRIVRGLAKRHIGLLIHETMHLELHRLATGGHPFLQSPLPTVDGDFDEVADA